jgi:purine-binding chemotaxis protein CheW
MDNKRVGGQLPPSTKQQILLARAQELAREEESTRVQEETLRVVEFLLGQEKYAVEASFVREVYHLKQLTPLPCIPSFVLGIVNVRGRILSVINLLEFFGLPSEPAPARKAVIVLRLEGVECGVLTDGIHGAYMLPVGAIRPVLPTWTGARTAYLRGMTEEHLMLLDAKRLLSDKRLVVGSDEIEL